MKISKSPTGMSEQYVVKFWFTNDQGFLVQKEETVYSNSRSAHFQIEKYYRKESSKYLGFKLISITYQ